MSLCYRFVLCVHISVLCVLQCCANDNVALAEVVLSYAVAVNSQDDNGSTPLHFACGYDHPELVQLLLEVSLSCPTAEPL